MDKALTEQQVLDKLEIPDFRHMTKEKIMTFASMLQNMDPEVAKKAIEQFPDFAKMALDALTDYRDVFEKTLDSNNESSKQCFKTYDEILDALKACVEREDIDFEERKFYIDKMMEIAQMAEKKDSENKNFVWKMIGTASMVVIAVVGSGAALLGGNVDFKLPKLK